MMLSGYHVITLTHRQASLAAIGHLVPAPERAQAQFEQLKATMNWDELLCLTTCNRAMFAFYTPQRVHADLLRFEFLSALRPDLDTNLLEELAGQLQYFQGGDAVRHIFEVAASMDSLVVGEREIVRQLREAYQHCAEWGLTGDHFRLLMRYAQEVSKQVCNETGIGDKALSIVALAYGEMIQSGIGKDARILMVGAGETNALMGKILLKNAFHHVTVLNRTVEKAEILARSFQQGRALSFDAIEQPIDFDVLIVCTAATSPIITPARFAALSAGSTGRKLLIDLSVPHNVAPEVLAQFDVQYIEIESLRNRAAQHLQCRESARQQAMQIITERVVAYRDAWHHRQVERSLRPMIDEIKQVKEKALNSVFAREMAALDPAAQALVIEMMEYMEKKAIAIPIKTIRGISDKMQQHHPNKVAETGLA